MGLRCLLGHDFGDPEIEREREERGDEMVVSVREVQTCRRCGEERVVSENKEVTSIRSPADVGIDEESTGAETDAEPTDAESTDAEAATTEAADAAPDPSPSEEYDAESDDGVILGDEKSPRDHGEWPDAPGDAEPADRVDAAAEAIAGAGEDADDERSMPEETGADAAETDADDATADDVDADPQVPAEEDEDVELLDADDESAAVESDASAAATDAAGSWPEQTGEDEGFAADPAGSGGPTDVSFGGGLTPEASATNRNGTVERADPSEPDRERGEYVGHESADESGVDDIVRVESETSGRSDVTEFFCPNCGHSRLAGESSMRTGDICPECHKGYIAERDA